MTRKGLCLLRVFGCFGADLQSLWAGHQALGGRIQPPARPSTLANNSQAQDSESTSAFRRVRHCGAAPVPAGNSDQPEEPNSWASGLGGPGPPSESPPTGPVTRSGSWQPRAPGERAGPVTPRRSCPGRAHAESQCATRSTPIELNARPLRDRTPHCQWQCSEGAQTRRERRGCVARVASSGSS